MSNEDFARLIDTIISRAPQLREAGVLSVTIGDSAFTLAAAEPVAPIDEASTGDAVEEPTDILRDPWTHGRPGKDAPKVMAVKRRKV